MEALALRMLNHLLGQSAWARARLLPFSGRRARFVMPPWQLDFAVTDSGIFERRHEGEEAGEPDVTVTLPAASPLQALQGIESAMAAAHVTGNAEFATELSFVLKNLRWDAEEDLSRFVGDIAAHRIVGGAQAFFAWQKRSAERLAENVAEYLGEEARLLTPRHELADLRDETARLSASIDALADRVKQLPR